MLLALFIIWRLTTQFLKTFTILLGLWVLVAVLQLVHSGPNAVSPQNVVGS